MHIQASNIKDFSAFRRRINQICISEFKIAYRKDVITIFTFCRDDHAKLFNYLRKGQIHAYSHKHRKDKKVLYVLKDLPRGLSMEVVEEGVQEWIDIDDIVITPLHKRKVDFDEDQFPYYVVHLPPEYDTRKLLKIKTILDFKIRWEKLNTRDRTTQCHRCQQYGHGSEYCSHALKCVKCIGSHLTKDYPTNDDDHVEVQCTNCKGQHPGSYRKCKAFSDYRTKLTQEKEARPARLSTLRNERQGALMHKP